VASTPETGGQPTSGWGRRRARHQPARVTKRARREHASILIARALSYIVSVTPLAFGYAVCDRIGDFLYWRSRHYRLNVIDNLRHVYGDRLSEPELRKRSRLVFRTSSRNFYDLIRTARLSREEFTAQVTLRSGSWSTVDAIRAAGKGCIIVTGHLGAFDSVPQILFVHGYDPYVLGTPTVDKFIYAGVLWLRSSHEARVEDVSPGAIRRMLRALKSGEFIGLVADRDFSSQGLPVTFFGRETTLPAGPARIGRDTGVPIVPVFSERGPNASGHRYLFHIEEPILIPCTDDEEADLRYGVEQITHVLEKHIARNPEQWVMFQRVWHDTWQRKRGNRKRGTFRTRSRASSDGASAPGLNDTPDIS